MEILLFPKKITLFPIPRELSPMEMLLFPMVTVVFSLKNVLFQMIKELFQIPIVLFQIEKPVCSMEIVMLLLVKALSTRKISTGQFHFVRSGLACPPSCWADVLTGTITFIPFSSRCVAKEFQPTELSSVLKM